MSTPTTKEEQDFIVKFNNIFKPQLKIVDLFNTLSKSTYEEYYKELTIEEEHYILIFDLVKNKLKYLEQTATEEEDFKKLLTIDVFKSLFINDIVFKMDDLDEKIFLCNILIKLLTNQILTEDESYSILYHESQILDMKIELFSEFLSKKDDNYYYAFCFYAILTYSEKMSNFLEYFISLIKYKFNLDNPLVNLVIKLDIKDKELQEMSKTDIIKDITQMYNNIENYVIIYIEDKHLKKKGMPLKQVNELINEDYINYESDLKKKNEKKKKKKSLNINYEKNKINKKVK